MNAPGLRRAAVGYTVAIAVSSAWWYWRVLRPATYAGLTILNYDLYAEVVPRLEYAYDTLGAGHLPLWNPYQLAGTPFLATQQHGVLYPLNLAHLVLPMSIALSITAVLHYAIAATATFALARDLGLRVAEALLAAAAFALSGSMFGKLYLPPHLYAAAWLPVQMLLVYRLNTRGVTFARVAALAAASALQFVGGYAQYCLFAAYLFAAYTLWMFARGPARRALNTAAALAASAALAALLAAAQLLPTAELMLMSPRGPGRLRALDVTGETPVALLRELLLVAPMQGVAGNLGVGVALLFLALLGAMQRGSIRERGFLLLGAVAALPVATGASGPLFSFVRLLPGYDWFRTPDRILVLLALFVALLSAAGLRQLHGAATRRAVLRLSIAPLACLALGAAVLLYLDPALWTPAPWLRFLWLAAALISATALRARGWRSTAFGAIAVLELVLMHQNRVVIPQTDPDFYRPAPDAVAYLRQHQGVWRTLVTDALEPMFQFQPQNPPKTGLLARIYSVSDYENLYPHAYGLYLGALQRREPLPTAWQGRVYGGAGLVDLRLLNLLGARFVLTSPMEPFTQPDDPRFPLVFRGQTASVLENPAARPRAFLADTLLPVSDTAQALAVLRAASFDPGHSITIEGWTGAPAALPRVDGSAEITLYEPERVAVRARSAGEAFLVLSDQDYPGWTARVDDEVTPIYRADGVFRAVHIPAGTHLVEFTFAPWSFRIGAGLTLLSLGALAFVLRRERLASRSRDSTPAARS